MKTIILCFLATFITPALAAAPVQILLGPVGSANTSREIPVNLIFLGAEDQAGTYDLPGSIPAELVIGDRRWPVSLVRKQQTVASVALKAGGFVQAAYTMQLPAGVDIVASAIVELPGGSAASFARAVTTKPGAKTGVKPGTTTPPPPMVSSPAGLAGDPSQPRFANGNAFLGNLSAYEPIYGVFGPGTDTEALLQFSFKYQLFGQAGNNGPGDPWLNNIYLGYTQRLFWDLRGQSSPFRNIDFRPELFYLLSARQLSPGLSLGGQAGIQHQSNGRDGASSRNFNTLYIQPTAEMPVGSYKLSLGVRLQTYVGDLSDNPDLVRYRGHGELFAQIGTDNGLRVSTRARMSLQTGRGAIDVETSYPLNRLILPNLNLYLFGQAFVGYGENLLDYNVHATRFRIGIAMVR